ncbi:MULTISPECIES: DUF2975 domain-containing protein [Flavobacterium]|uniref:DUF2975 domain-containing protein n=1 Tax=Flavobacterium TaxID=237 RepID=UPI001FCA560D|nr:MULTISPECIES: DUF2975 domain-containing protein [Flavobacterium]UOK41387.1 DUF2975 domain-containing protein [Flavobacterium enshiense]
MKLVRIIASYLHIVVKIVAVAYLLTAFYALINCVFEGPFFERMEENRFAINFPFTNQHFLLGSEFTLEYVSEMVLGLALYGLFFWVLGNVFKTFKQERLFTKDGLRNLKQFYQFNLLLYPVVAVLWSVISIEDFPFLAMIVAHAIMGVFIFFMAAIFQQGVSLQNEQDLYI